ncbi:MAG: CDGSH iron-sulfur domain-containing protein [Thermoanaerobaculia bacterium]
MGKRVHTHEGESIRVTWDARSGEIRTGNRGALCRCGGSSRKPWCDGTHKQIGFRSD